MEVREEVMETKTKKILYVTTVSSTINVFLIPHIKRLLQKGYIVEIACNIDKEISKELIDLNVKLHIIDFSRNPLSKDNLKAYWQIRKLNKKERYDAINVHTPVASFITRTALRKEKLKMIYTCHGFHFFKGGPIFNWIAYYPLERMAAKWTDMIVTINTEDLNRAKSFKLRNNGQVKLMRGVGIDPDKYSLKVFNREEYRRKLGLNKEDFVLLILAELNKNKNHIQIIKAMELLKDKYPNIKVLCAGKGPLEDELRDIVRKMNLENNIKFIGFRNDVKELLHSCDCIGLFSIREGLGKCLLEGMIAEKPLIATNTRGPRELIENNKNGYLLELGDFEVTAKSIEKLYIDKKKYIDFVNISRKKISKYYIDNVLNEVVNFF